MAAWAALSSNSQPIQDIFPFLVISQFNFKLAKPTLLFLAYFLVSYCFSLATSLPTNLQPLRCFAYWLTTLKLFNAGGNLPCQTIVKTSPWTPQVPTTSMSQLHGAACSLHLLIKWWSNSPPYSPLQLCTCSCLALSCHTYTIHHHTPTCVL